MARVQAYREITSQIERAREVVEPPDEASKADDSWFQQAWKRVVD